MNKYGPFYPLHIRMLSALYPLLKKIRFYFNICPSEGPRLLIAQSMKKILHLVTPELCLVLDIFFISKILYEQNGLIGDI